MAAQTAVMATWSGSGPRLTHALLDRRWKRIQLGLPLSRFGVVLAARFGGLPRHVEGDEARGAALFLLGRVIVRDVQKAGTLPGAQPLHRQDHPKQAAQHRVSRGTRQANLNA